MGARVWRVVVAILRRLIKNRFVLAVLYYVQDDALCRARLARGDISTNSGMTHEHGDIERSIDYIEEVFRDYRFYGGIDRFYGRVAELGPGDSCGVGLLFLADGCESVDLADRFYSQRDPEYHAEVYRVLGGRHPELRSRHVSPGIWEEQNFRGLRRHLGASAAAETFFETRRGYDFIVSRAVLEHVYDPLLALEKMADALNPGGMLLHKVDLRDHEMFSREHHELKFLEVPDWVYPYMTRASGRPNRILVNRYRQALQCLDLDFELLVTRLAGVGEITPHLVYSNIDSMLRKQSLDYIRSVRCRFARSLRDVADEDLSVAGFFLVARRRKQSR
jgi:SAM-dependent methyltransferase